uniref:Uncharacterized protein n=1 Tax=Strigamia maritima TaxID=126957 RepID=T1IPE2_STRMM
MAEEAEYCVPAWDDLTYDYKSCSEIVKECRFDHGMMGIDVIKNTNVQNSQLTVSFAKSYRQMCFHSVTPSMPCVSPETISKYFFANLNLTKSEKARLASIRHELRKFQAAKRYKDHAAVIDLMFTDPVYVPDDDLPSFLKRYKKALLNTPDKESFWQHHRSALTTVDVEGKYYVLFSGGENFNKLRKLRLDGDWNNETQVHNLKSKCMKTFESENGPILQITTTKVQNSILGALRQRKKCYLYKINEKCKLENIDTLTTNDNFNLIIDVAPSPYIAGEFIYLTENGAIQTKKLDVNVAVDISKPLMNHHKPPISVHFGAHPRSIISASPKQIRLTDTRASCVRSFPLLSLPDVTLPPHDTICSTAPFVGNDDIIVITTTTSVLLLDQRYPDKYTMKWSHLLQHAPEMTSIKPLFDDREVIILAGSTKNQDVALMHVERKQSSIYTRCPTMHLSRPNDLLHFLPRGETHPVASLVSAPLIGIDLFPNDSLSSATVLQLSASGQMYAQNVRLGVQNGTESEWRVGPGMENGIDHNIDEWADEMGAKCVGARKLGKFHKREHMDASDLGAALRDYPKENIDEAFGLPQIFENDEENENCDYSIYGLREVEVMDYDDEISNKLANVWTSGEIEDEV